MNKKMIFFGLLFSLVFWGTTTFAEQMVATAYPMDGRNLEASWLIGQQVNSREGDVNRANQQFCDRSG